MEKKKCESDQYTPEEIEILKTYGRETDVQLIEDGITDLDGNRETLLSMAKRRKEAFEKVELLINNTHKEG